MQDLVEHLFTLLADKHLRLVTAESCTGGLLAATLTHKAGASAFFERGFITYSNESKTELLGVPEPILTQHGAVSPETAQAMAHGALKSSRADLAVSITGIAGPDGGTPEKPVGLVYFGYALRGGSEGSIEHRFHGARNEIQSAAVMLALKHLITVLEKTS
jgi:nicotinamide-nucleotide amidase